jgi:CheY-like chemotaxis protein
MQNARRFVLLLVEDEQDDVLFFKRALAKSGHSFPVFVARDGEEAVAYLSGEGHFADRSRFPMPTHVLLDLKLPRKSGMDVLGWMRENDRTRPLPAAILTSSGQTPDRDRANLLGAGSYWIKPVSYDDLQELLGTIFDWMRESCHSKV